MTAHRSSVTGMARYDPANVDVSRTRKISARAVSNTSVRQDNVLLRRARVIHLARRRLDPLILELKSKPTNEWPPHLNEAYKLLRKSDFSDKEIRSVVVRSISAAQACAREINRRSDDVVRLCRREFECQISLPGTPAQRRPLSFFAPGCASTFLLELSNATMRFQRGAPCGDDQLLGTERYRGRLFLCQKARQIEGASK